MCNQGALRRYALDALGRRDARSQCSRRLGAAVITSDAGDIAKLNPTLPVVQV